MKPKATEAEIHKFLYRCEKLGVALKYMNFSVAKIMFERPRRLKRFAKMLDKIEAKIEEAIKLEKEKIL